MYRSSHSTIKGESMILRMLVVICCILASCISRNSVNIPKTSPLTHGISFSGGNGDSFHEAVKINGARDKSTGVASEYRYISDKHGVRGTDWFLVGQTVIREKSKIVDVIEIQLKEASDRRIFYFDVTDFMVKKR